MIERIQSKIYVVLLNLINGADVEATEQKKTCMNKTTKIDTEINMRVFPKDVHWYQEAMLSTKSR